MPSICLLLMFALTKILLVDDVGMPGLASLIFIDVGYDYYNCLNPVSSGPRVAVAFTASILLKLAEAHS